MNVATCSQCMRFLRVLGPTDATGHRWGFADSCMMAVLQPQRLCGLGGSSLLRANISGPLTTTTGAATRPPPYLCFNQQTATPPPSLTGHELLINPSILLLDEPTSGLGVSPGVVDGGGGEAGRRVRMCVFVGGGASAPITDD